MEKFIKKIKKRSKKKKISKKSSKKIQKKFLKNVKKNLNKISQPKIFSDFFSEIILNFFFVFFLIFLNFFFENLLEIYKYKKILQKNSKNFLIKMSFLGVNIWPHTWNVKIAFYFMLFAFIYFQFNRVCKSYVMRGNGFLFCSCFSCIL